MRAERDYIEPDFIPSNLPALPSYKELADSLCLSVGTIYQTKHKGKRRAKKVLLMRLGLLKLRELNGTILNTKGAKK